MRTLLNVLWLVLAGFWLALGYVAAGIICCILIITIPFGIASFRIAGYALWPFGRSMVRKPGAGTASLIGNVIWIVLVGWWLALGHLVTGALLCLTIIGIPFGIANFKLIPISLTPLGHEIVDTGDSTAFQPPRTA
ncbi:YccF domain-containing protein [Actinomadura craniellae]|uniref:YccF domain-containing protein n=1 Tax=Actinomadura craniellae TaxID=2231787 RepID=A0A365GY71_9ACTN|nr:YccF domain-containing protein [Actinomadura craniellae]RAY11779.1 YccF domain-containing protein [Actinomadura craniellae]